MKHISVIIPVYKVEPYLRKCVDSVLAQSFTNIELILVDDGSPDKCGDICDEYAMVDSRVKVIHRTNGGLSAARNSGLELAKGEWVVFIDSDDWINTRYIENLLAMDNGKVKVLLSAVNEEFGDRQCFVGPKKDDYYSAEEIYDKYNLLAVWACGKAFRRELLTTIRFKEGIIQEDEFFTHQIFFTNGEIGYSADAVYHYVHRGDSIVGGKWNSARLICVEGMKAQWKFFVEHNLPIARKHVEERLLQWLAVAIMRMRADCPEDMESQSLLHEELTEAMRKYRRALERSPVIQYTVGLAVYPKLSLLLKLRYAARLLFSKGPGEVCAKLFKARKREQS